jgi:superfamily II DNA helicase RecQ
VIASPEYVEQDSRFRTILWNSEDFRKRVKRIIFDEAHCVLDWGDFRPSYKRLTFLRPLIPHATIFALSATLTPGMIKQLKDVLGLANVELVRLSNDRKNIAYIVKPTGRRPISLHHLGFLISSGLTVESPPPPKFMVFMNTKVLCEEGAEFLRQRLPRELQGKIVWVHADMTRGFNERALSGLREGSIWGVVCTDVAGMVSKSFYIYRTV